MTEPPSSRGAKLVTTYLAVLAAMVAWWLVLQVSTAAGPLATLALAYLVPLLAWVIVTGVVGGRR